MSNKYNQKNHHIFILLVIVCLVLQVSETDVFADDSAPSYTPAELSRINEIKAKYSDLASRDYVRGNYNIYSVPPTFSYPYNAGFIKQDYIDDTTNWINYYRFLLNLPPATNAAKTNEDGTANTYAQLGAYLLAASNADPGKYQHNLTNAVRPSYIPTPVWNQGKPYTNFAVLYFNTNLAEETAYFSISSLIADNYDYLTPEATGHRADLLSSRLSNFGVGVAYGTNGTKYEVIHFDNTLNDIMSKPSREIVNYPAEGVFPIEELTQSNTEQHPIYWSIYFSNDYLIPKTGLSVTVKNDTDETSGNATNVKNVQADNVAGHYASALTYIPPKNVKLQSGNQYTVSLKGLDPQKYKGGEYSYTFKLFNEVGAQIPIKDPGNTVDMKQDGIATVRCGQGSIPVYDSYPANHKKTGQYLINNSRWKTSGISYSNNTFWFKVGDKQWINGIYVESNNYSYKSIATINYLPKYGIRVWTSPFFNKKPVGNKFLKTGTKWKTFKATTVNNASWFNLGGNQWVDGKYLIVK
ncbi:hypothetical protein [Xylocopilactobacillus apis]|uniref:SCP domain-containing protein n=1 Tax=Xylocopilactobacillus apis TaxID=2932183 RepID=A0AAU9D8M5_9LACO|nr:hypothetical protein [Xylocopilactobacillus apis]BDR56025.1 hypothetical protein KIMC2_05870 [Xylocopilactobacillus apis]